MPQPSPATTAPTKTHERQPVRIAVKKPATTRIKADKTARYADVVMRAVTANFAETTFTRDDIMTVLGDLRPDVRGWGSNIYGINDVTTATRYRQTCAAVALLLSTGRLKSLDWLRLCLPAAFPNLAAEVPPHMLYVATVRRIIQENFNAATMLDAMMVVRVWKSDQHVPENVKRMAVRGIFPELVRAKMLRRNPENNTFIVLDLTLNE